MPPIPSDRAAKPSATLRAFSSLVNSLPCSAKTSAFSSSVRSSASLPVASSTISFIPFSAPSVSSTPGDDGEKYSLTAPYLSLA